MHPVIQSISEQGFLCVVSGDTPKRKLQLCIETGNTLNLNAVTMDEGKATSKNADIENKVPIFDFILFIRLQGICHM